MPDTVERYFSWYIKVVHTVWPFMSDMSRMPCARRFVVSAEDMRPAAAGL